MWCLGLHLIALVQLSALLLNCEVSLIVGNPAQTASAQVSTNATALWTQHNPIRVGSTSFSFRFGENSTILTPFTGKVNVSEISSAATKGVSEHAKFRGLNSTLLPENLSTYAMEKNQSHFIKSPARVLSVPPSGQTLNNSAFINPSINSSAMNLRGLSHNPITLWSPTNGFLGLNYSESCKGCLPPDIGLAVGQKYVVETVNGWIGFWTKQGTLMAVKDINAFFNINNDHITADPSILFDRDSDRWFASILDANTDSVQVSVSSSADPLGTWNVIMFPSDGCPDRPEITVSSDKFVLGYNYYSKVNGQCPYNGGKPEFRMVQYIVADKLAMTNGTIVKSRVFADRDSFSLFPVKSIDSRSAVFMVSVGSKEQSILQVMSIVGTAPDNLVITSIYPRITPNKMPASASQRATNLVIDTGDDRVLDAKVKEDGLWLASNDLCNNAGDTVSRSCIRLIEFNLTSNRVVQDFDAGFGSFYYMYPSLIIDNVGDLMVMFAYSSNSTFPSLGLLEHAVNSRTGNYTFNTPLKAGHFADLQGDKKVGASYEYEKCEPDKPDLKCVRYGDYFGTAQDPYDASLIWMAGEYYDAPVFSTFITRLSGK